MGWKTPKAQFKHLALGLLAGTATVAISVGALAAERVALVMGNGAYRDVPQLLNAHNDANDVARMLQELDFLVIEAIDQDLAGMKEELGAFEAELDDAELALVFYAGHAVQMSGQNYILPTDANPNDARAKSLSMQRILNMMVDHQVDTRIVMLDACRDNPFADAEMQEAAALTRGLRPSGDRGTTAPSDGGLAAVEATDVGTFVAYATAPGSVALDGDERNSPFTAALLKHLAVPGAPLTSVMQKVRGDVVTETGGKQVPWDSSSLTADPILNTDASGERAVAPAPAVAASTPVATPDVAVEALLTGDQTATRSLADALDPVVVSQDGAAMLDALRRGEPASALVLADMIIQGRMPGFAPNSEESRTLAMQLLALAAGQGQREAPIALVQLIEGSDGTRLTLDDALLRLSDYLATGTGGLPVNQELSLSFLIESAGRNNALAQLYLADRLRNGEGFDADTDHALKIYNKIKRSADFAGTDPSIVADAQAGIDAIRGGAFVAE